MQLVSDIINELVDTTKSVSGALLKTKVLASRLRSIELSAWVSNELNGYDSEEALPKYRRFSGNIVASYINGNMQFKNASLPIPFDDEKLRNTMSAFNLKDSITTLETMIGQSTSKAISISFPEQALRIWESTLIDMGNPYLQIFEAHKTLPASAVVEVISVVRAKLLDFLLKIDEQFGNITEIELQRKKEQIATIMNQTIINNSGDGNVVNTGNDANINAEITIAKGDKNALSDKLLAEGVNQEDVKELLLVVDDEVPTTAGQFGNKVNTWMKKMINKAIDGTWQVGIGAAGGILVELLKNIMEAK